MHIKGTMKGNASYLLHLENEITSGTNANRAHAMMCFECNRAGADNTSQVITMGIDANDGNFKIADFTALGTSLDSTANSIFEIQPIGAGTGVCFYPDDADARVYIGNEGRPSANNSFPLDLDDADVNAYFQVGGEGDTMLNMIAVYGGGQSDAFVYFGQSSNYGGFVGYQGDSSGPGELDNLETDRIMIGRTNDGTPEDVIYFAYNSNNVSVLGSLTDSVSDERVKTNVRSIDNAINKIKQIRGVYYDYNEHAVETHYMSQEDWDKGLYKGHVGLIAQEVEKVLPEVVTDGEYKSVAYGNIVGVLIEAIKEQQKQIDELKKDK